MVKYSEIKQNSILEKMQNIHKIIQMKLKSNQKSHNKKTIVTNLKSSTKEIIYTIILIINFFSLFAKLNQNILINLTEVTLKVKGVGNIKYFQIIFFKDIINVKYI